MPISGAGSKSRPPDCSAATMSALAVRSWTSPSCLAWTHLIISCADWTPYRRPFCANNPMTTKLNLNKWQRSNVALLTPIVLETLRSGDWRNTPAPIMKCTNCGSRITTPIMKFYDFDGKLFLCYKCQGRDNKLI